VHPVLALTFFPVAGVQPQVREARERFAGMLEKPVRVVRNGKVVATIDYDESGYGETCCEGQI